MNGVKTLVPRRVDGMPPIFVDKGVNIHISQDRGGNKPLNRDKAENAG